MHGGLMHGGLVHGGPAHGGPAHGGLVQFSAGLQNPPQGVFLSVSS